MPEQGLAAYHERALALGGQFQALALVQQVARTGQVEETPFETCMSAVLRTDAESTEAVFGGRDRLRLGLQSFAQHIESGARGDVELSRYWVSVHVLERKLSRRAALLNALAEGIASAAREAEENGPGNPRLVTTLAELYKRTLSTLTPRIMVSGEPRLLNEAEVADRIRALLLCAVRCAVLWRQVGGSRLGLLFSRRQLAGAARELLEPL